MAGRPPKPTELKVITGNPGKRAINRQEPDPDYLQDMAPPATLPDWAHACWNEIAPKLRAARVLTVLDVPMLEMLCVSLAHYRAQIQKMEPTTGVWLINGQLGNYRHPMVDVNGTFRKQAIEAMQYFGMSPAARARVLINPQGDLFADQQNGTPKTGNGYFT